MQQLTLIVHIFSCIALIALVLMQHGKGADIGAGGGASGTFFGSSGSNSFLLNLTSVLAAIFFICSLTLSYLAAKSIPANTMLLPTTALPLQEQSAAERSLSDEETSAETVVNNEVAKKQ